MRTYHFFLYSLSGPSSLFYIILLFFSYTRKNEQLVECRRRKRAKKQEKIQDVKERMKSHLSVGPIGDELSNAAVENSMLLKMVILVCHNMSRGYENVHKGYMG